ncbi:MAG: adenylosuccinate lyase, partial [Dehalococcoidia bacterium]|nr:adenylosuccinate lyase [Dehalococcoidia bacterium]
AERLILPDSCIVLDYMLDLFTGVVSGMTVHTDRMKANLDGSRGVVFSQKLLLAMVEAGARRDEAYGIVQRISQRALDEGLELRELAAGEPRVREHLAPEEIKRIFDYHSYVRHVDESFERAGLV